MDNYLKITSSLFGPVDKVEKIIEVDCFQLIFARHFTVLIGYGCGQIKLDQTELSQQQKHSW